jgi:hypothetical protein
VADLSECERRLLLFLAGERVRPTPHFLTCPSCRVLWKAWLRRQARLLPPAAQAALK